LGSALRRARCAGAFAVLAIALGAAAAVAQSPQSSASPAASSNFINISSPADGSTVGASFSVLGTTRPNAHVHVGVAGTNTAGDTTAGTDGTFSVNVSGGPATGGEILVNVTSTQADNGAVARVRFHLRVSQL
jgi:hypothetical protein